VCGAICGGTCSAGTCLACNNTVLVLGSDQTARDREMVTALIAAGLNPTLIEGGVITYAGVPAASGFGVIVPVVGNHYERDMPAAGQASIVAAQAAGRGVVLSEWGAYHRLNGRWATLDPLLLFTRSSGTTAVIQYTNTVAHPIWTGLPTSFSSTVTMGGNISGSLVHGGVQIASSTQTGIGVAVRATPAGRVAQISLATQYSEGSSAGLIWTTDANTTRLFTNSILWAAGCR